MSKLEQSLNTYSVSLIITQTEEDIITVEAINENEAEEIVRANYYIGPRSIDGCLSEVTIDSITQRSSRRPSIKRCKISDIVE